MSWNLGAVFRIVNLVIAAACVVAIAAGSAFMAGFILSQAFVWLWSPMLVMKIAMIRVRARARFWERQATRADVAIAFLGSCIVGPIAAHLVFGVLGALFGRL